MTTKAWLHSMAAGAISAAATSVTTCVVDPAKFNFTAQGLAHLGEVALLSAALSVCALLMKSPLPE